jgi:hypothetical protein
MSYESIDDLKKRFDSIMKEADAINQKIQEKLKETLVACQNNMFGYGCGMASVIGDLTYIQTHWYESPHGCMEGDSWHQAEGQWICPHCNHKNRLYDKPEIQKLKSSFKNFVNEFNDR